MIIFDRLTKIQNLRKKGAGWGAGGLVGLSDFCGTN